MKSKQLLFAMCISLAACSTALAQGPPSPPAASPNINVAAVIQASANTGIELRLTAQLVQAVSHLAPYRNVVLPLAASGGYVLTPAASAPTFTALCSLTNSDTMLECLLSPSPGPGWNNDNPLAVSVQLTAANGGISTTLVTFSGGAVPSIQTAFQAGTAFPTAANSAPIYLSAQLTRNVINLTPIESSPLTLSAYTLTEAVFSHPASFGCALTNSSTMLECTLVPDGLTWGPGGPIVVRLELTSVEGAKATTLVQFRIN